MLDVLQLRELVACGHRPYYSTPQAARSIAESQLGKGKNLLAR